MKKILVVFLIMSASGALISCGKESQKNPRVIPTEMIVVDENGNNIDNGVNQDSIIKNHNKYLSKIEETMTTYGLLYKTIQGDAYDKQFVTGLFYEDADNESIMFKNLKVLYSLNYDENQLIKSISMTLEMKIGEEYSAQDKLFIKEMLYPFLRYTNYVIDIEKFVEEYKSSIDDVSYMCNYSGVDVVVSIGNGILKIKLETTGDD